MCGERSEIRPIWFVLQSQIKKESGEGKIAERCGAGTAPRWQHTHTHAVATASNVDQKASRTASINNQIQGITVLYAPLLPARLYYI